MATVFQDLTCPAVLINSVEDHTHILFELSRTVAISEVVERVKKGSSKWIKTKGTRYTGFAWQAGYGIFAVSESNIPEVRDYIGRQQEHHRKRTFKEEFLAFLKRHNVAFDEKYLWD